MKKTICKLILILLIFSSGINAQNTNSDSNGYNNPVAELLRSEGTLLKKEYVVIGKESGVEFQNLYITNISTKELRGTLVIKVTLGDWFWGTERELENTISTHEIEDCIKSLQYIKNDVLNTTPESYTELIYRTNSGVTIGAYYQIGSFQKWNIVLGTRYSLNNSSKTINIKNIDKLIELFIKSKKELDKIT